MSVGGRVERVYFSKRAPSHFRYALFPAKFRDWEFKQELLGWARIAQAFLPRWVPS